MSDKDQVRSIKKALSIMRFLGEHNEMTFVEVAKALNLPNTTVYRILKTLASDNYVRQDDNGRYSLGLGLLKLSEKLLGNMKLRTIADPFLEDLAKKTKESINLSTWSEDEVVCVNTISAGHSLRTEASLGQKFSIHSTAGGKVLLSFAPEEKKRRILRKIKLIPFTKNTITEVNELKKHLGLIQQQGFAIDNEETSIGGKCIGAPIKDRPGEAVAAISISGPSARITSDKLNELVCLVKSTAREISARLGVP
jgi:DNA-binding IclR family transcriptional regulator